MCSRASWLGEPFCSVRKCCVSSDQEMEALEPPRKKGRKDDAAAPSTSRCRFSDPTSPRRMLKICKGVVPANTEKATGWACCVFEEWRDKWNKTAREKCPLTLLEEPDAHALSCWLSRGNAKSRWLPLFPYIYIEYSWASIDIARSTCLAAQTS